MSRTGWLGALALLTLVVGAVFRISWPSDRPALECDPSRIHWVDAGTAQVATCVPGAPPEARPAGPALLLGLRLDLNRATEEDLRLIPGVGPRLARALVEARTARGGFKSWEEVDEVPGVGPVKLARLKEAADLRP